MTTWVPVVVSGLGSSALTGTFAFGGIWWQQRRHDRAAATQDKSAAYHQFIARSLAFSARAQTLRNVMQTRSGLKEGVDVVFGLRRPVDLLELHDWLAKDFQPVNDAWSKIQMIGSAEAIEAATELLDACGDLIELATTPGNAHGKIASTVKGIAWTPDQQEALQAAMRRVAASREAFITIARKELGKEAVMLPLERAKQEKAVTGEVDEPAGPLRFAREDRSA